MELSNYKNKNFKIKTKKFSPNEKLKCSGVVYELQKPNKNKH